jgi:hypothetical protein
MAKITVLKKKKRGPASTGKGIQIRERWHPPEIAAIDAWIAASNEKTLTRAHAIRRLVGLGLTVKRAGTLSEHQKNRARDMAGKAIDAMTDSAATVDDQIGRKRRLTKGPPEFREDRVDMPKVRVK